MRWPCQRGRHALTIASVVLTACGPAPGESTSGTSGSASTKDATGETSATTTAGDVTKPGSDLPTDLPIPDCDAEITFPEGSLLVDEPMGFIAPYDMDLDGTLDAVGGRGIILLGSGEVRKLSGVPTTNDGRPGRFVVDGLPDLLYATSTDDQLIVFPSAASQDPPAPVATQGTMTSGSFATADYDGDGVDDVALASSLSDAVEVWRGLPDGTFEAGPRLDTTVFPAVGFMRYGDAQTEHLIVTDLDEDVVIFRVEDNALIEVSRFFQPGAQAMTGLDADGSGIEHMLLHVWWSNSFEIFSSAGVLFNESGRWGGPYFDLGEALARDYVSVDLDADGDLDLVVVTDDVEQSLEFQCLSPSGYTLCGRMTPDVEIHNLGIILDPPRLLLSTDHDTRAITLPARLCLET